MERYGFRLYTKASCLFEYGIQRAINELPTPTVVLVQIFIAVLWERIAGQAKVGDVHFGLFKRNEALVVRFSGYVIPESSSQTDHKRREARGVRRLCGF